MEYVSLGKTNLLVSRTSFGAMSLDCKEIEEHGEEADEIAANLVHQAYDGGVNFFDTSHSRPVCEQRLGTSLHGIRQNIFLATKSTAKNADELQKDLDESLLALDSDFIDLYQIENPDSFPGERSANGIFKKLLKLKNEGIIRHFGIATDNIDIANEAVESQLYETIQFPFNILNGDSVLDLVKKCAKNDIGFIAMQPLCGGVLNNIPLALGYIHQYENVVPVWGVRSAEELQQILYFDSHPPVIDEQFHEETKKIREFFN